MTTKNEEILREAKKRFKRCAEWEDIARNRYLDDIKFANADPDNGYQWPDELRSSRDLDDRPCLTINRTRQHNLQIINDAKQNTPQIRINAVGNGATVDSAKTYQGVCRYIEYKSNAQAIYDHATVCQVNGGVGYWRIVTDYAGDDTFDQEIYIRPIRDPLTVFLDPDAREPDKCDANFGFVFDDMPRDQFEDKYPRHKDLVSTAPIGNADGWIDKDHVRVAEYFRRVPTYDHLVHMTDPVTGAQSIIPKSQIPPDVWAMLREDETTQTRDVISWRVEWYKIAADTILEKNEWAGKYIPIVQIVGEETIIDGKLDRKGHTRYLKDPQRIYNYWSSSAVENVALQTKTPWVADARSIEGLESYWETANRHNHSVLPYKGVDDAGQPIPPPNRVDPPTMATAYVQGMQVAQQEMMMASGQYEAQFGEQGNERSGKAINERQRQGDIATYHFIDNLAIGIRYTGKILIDLIPKIYDTPRVIKILADDGAEEEVEINPEAQQAYLQRQIANGKAVKSIFNPNVGKYDVIADVGPAYETKRQQAFDAISVILQQQPELVKVCGDLLFKAADFPMADEIAERLRRMVPANVLGDAPSPEVEALQQQMGQMQKVIEELVTKVTEKQLEIKGKDAQRDVDIYDAITKRIAAISNAQPELGENEIKPVVAQTLAEMLGFDISKTEGTEEAA